MNTTVPPLRSNACRTWPSTFPARPMNGGPLPEAPPKLGGRWWYEPKYNGWRVTVHTPTASCFNRHGQPLSILDDFTSALERLRLSCPFEWLDCEGLERRHGIGRGTLMVLDTIDDAGKFYDERQRLLDDWETSQSGPERLAIGIKPEADSLYRVPYYCTELAQHAWYRMPQLNREWCAVFYEGLVAKRASSLYPRQLTDSKREFTDWVKHRFV